MPLIRTYWLSSKKGSQAWLEPVIDKAAGSYHFDVQARKPEGCVGIGTDSMNKHVKRCSSCAAIAEGTKNSKGGFRCLLTDAPIPFDHVRAEGQQDRLGSTMVAIVAEANRGRFYLNATAEHHAASDAARPASYPDTELPEDALGFRVQNYGIRKHWQMFTPRQLTAIITLSDLVKDIGPDIREDAAVAGVSPQEADQYECAVTTFLALALDRCVSFNNSFCRWNGNQTVFIFTRAAIPMLWDFSEANIMGDRAVCWQTAVDISADALETLQPSPTPSATARQIDAASGANGLSNLLVSTDPPYYDNIGYAALSDVFYVWLRHTIGPLYPELFSTVLVPKAAELTAAPERFDGNKEKAREHFESGFRNAFTALRQKMDPGFPLTVYYAFKQADEESGADEEEGETSVDLTTGWETLLEALVSSGFQITGTWPVRASFKWRVRALGSNALASYIVLACRSRPINARQTDRRSFVAELKRELPSALRHLQQGNIAPVDFAQAAIGPGMAVYSRYSRILESKGGPMTVRAALTLINQDSYGGPLRTRRRFRLRHPLGDGVVRTVRLCRR